ncbi:5'/3'-nucleotidase SurE [Fluviicola sp.]|uniref:5'/3'-nucleotidase SurE n=1 Tax=Fluviicola sp. TaxID=1917219 RepID=UPI0031CE40CB
MKNSNRPLIFVTNDDSLHAKGIASLVAVAQEFGDVVVIAPDKPQSGMGHAITISHPLRLYRSDIFEGIEAYSCSGTPVDCVKLGVYEVLHRKPDLILSGVNHGLNSSTNVLYSGTMSAAVEGAMEHVPSIGFSYGDFDPDADFSAAMHVANQVIPQILEHGLPQGVCLNVNIPKGPLEALKGIEVCRQAYAFWEDRFDKRMDQFGRPYYWLTGTFDSREDATDTDLHFLDQGYATIVPTQFDLTAHKTIADLKKILV